MKIFINLIKNKFYFNIINKYLFLYMYIVIIE